MATFSKQAKQRRVEHARQLYCKGFDAQTIADIMGDLKPSTIQRWINEFDFEKSKRSQLIALSEIRNSILESYAALLDGETPKVRPDEAVKYAKAFEAFSAKKQVLTYMHEAFQMLDEQFCRDIQTAKKTVDKQRILDSLRDARQRMQTVITRLTNEVIGDE